MVGLGVGGIAVQRYLDVVVIISEWSTSDHAFRLRVTRGKRKWG